MTWEYPIDVAVVKPQSYQTVSYHSATYFQDYFFHCTFTHFITSGWTMDGKWTNTSVPALAGILCLKVTKFAYQ